MKVVAGEHLGIESRRNALSPAQRAILDVRLKGNGAIADVAVTKKRASGEFIPLIPNQHRLWLHQQLAVESASYHLGLGVRIRGEVRSELLELCLNRLIERHDAFRVTFRVVSGEPVQIVSAPFATSLPVVDLSSLADGEREETIEQEASNIRSQAFDLEVGPLFRARLFKCGSNEFVFLMVTHHIISDGWSQGIVMRDLAAMYSAETGRNELRLPKLEMQFSDYAWEYNERRHNELHNERAAAWWKDARSGAARLPFDKPQPGTARSRTIVRSRKLVPALLLGLGDLAKRNGTTVYVILLAAFGVFLRRYTGQTEFLILSPTANRDRAETVDIVGYLVDTLWLKVEVPADSTFADYVKDIHQAVIRAYEFRDTSPPLAVLGPSGDGEADIGGDVMQLGFFFDNSPTPGLNTAEFTIIRRAFAKAEAKFTLALVVQTNLAVPSIGFEFRRELFEPATVEGMLSNFWHLLEGIVCDADRRLSALPLLTTAERHRLAVEWNDTAAAYPSDKCLHELFAAQAARTPDAVAVTYEDRCLSYGELDRRSNQLAHYLRGLGVGPEIVVGLCVERSPEMVIGLLGILKAGGAYLPLDPSYPPERLGYMVADAAAPILVTQASLVEQLPRCDARLVSVDADWEEIARQRQELPASGACAENLAYVIYTSGSTGKPKGAMIRHCAVVNLLFTLRQRLGFTADDIVLAVTRFSFDMSVPEFYLPLLSGGSVALQSRQVAASGARLNDAIRNAGATVMQATPTSWSMLLDAGWCPTDGLRVWCGGEAFPAHLAAALNVAGAEIWNLYGPTETTVWSSASRLVPGCGVPLGRPLGNMRLYVLDDWLEVLPLGARGELYVGGIGLARGYLKRAALTAERFVPSPFGHGERLYRTGDLARWRADGELEFLGRADHQVKLRGYRIELGEIEAALRRHDGIQDAVVVTRGDDAGDKRLVGYVVRRSDAARPDAGALRAHVKQSLPDYMVPSAFVVIDALPLTPNGKIDRKALPAPASGEGIVQAAYEAARSPTEEVLAGIWCEVLKLDRVGVHDNFFELGGHSLLATRVTARLREAFAVELALRAVFEAPTLQGLAAHVEELRRQAAGTPLPPLQAQPRPQQLPLSFEQERIWFVDRLFPESVAQHLPLAVRVHGPFDVTALQRALEAIAQRHSVLRSRFPAIDGRPQQIVSQSTSIAVMRIDLTDIAPANRHEELHSRLIEQQRRRFDLERDPPIRICLFELGSSERVLSATIHHIAADGWSLGIFVRELEHLYRAFSRSEEPSLPELPIQYADFASWQRTTFHMEPIQAQLRYWTDTLRGALPSIALPTDRMRPARMTFTAAARSALVPKELAGGLVAVARGRKATLFMVLLAALKLVLFRWTGQKDLVVGTVMGNRHHVATEGLIGCFLNFLPLRSILSEADTFPAILQRCRNMILQAYANLDCPFEKIIEAVNPPRRLNQTPLYNVGLLLQNYPKQLTTADGGLSRISLPNRTAQLDLRLIATEIDNGILIECEYGTELFEAATIVNLLDFYVGVLDRVSNAPDIRLADVALPPALAAQVVMSGGRFGSAAADKADDSILELLAGIESLSDAEAEIGAATAKGLRDEHVG
jgi:amino acid adenylation domain-containing protein